MFFAFLSKTTRRICAKFFLGFRRKHLFIATYIEKHCTRPLRSVYTDDERGLEALI